MALTKAHFRMIDGSAVNVKDFGAVGDGVTDDTAAIQAAIDSLPLLSSSPITVRNGVIYFPRGKYLVTNIVLPEGVSLKGEARQAGYSGSYEDDFGSRILVNTTTGNTIQINGGLLDGSGISIKDLNFTASPDTINDTSLTSVNVIYINKGFRISITDCEFNNISARSAISCAPSTNELRIENVSVTKIGDPTPVRGGGYTYGRGLDIFSAPDSTIINCFIEFCGDRGVLVGANTKIIGCFIDLCKTGIQATNERVIISNCSIKLNEENGISIDGSSSNGGHIVISNNIISGNNHALATGLTDNWAIRLNADVTNFIITGNDLTDNYPSFHPTKTEYQNGIHLGASGNFGVLSNNSFPDSLPSGGSRLYDPNGNLILCQVVGNNTDGSSSIDSVFPDRIKVGTLDTALSNNSSDTSSDNGIVLNNTGLFEACRYAGTVMNVNRTGSDGTAIAFQRSGSFVGGLESTALGTRVRLTSGNVRLLAGTGSPEGVYGADVGSIFVRTNGGASTTLYVKESGTGNTGWVAK